MHQTPKVLTDALFEYYGGNISNSSIGQRKAAYVIAELAAEQDLGTFLLPTTVTGTYMYQDELMLEHAYVHRVSNVQVKAFDNDVIFTITGTSNWYMNIRDAEYGIIDFGLLLSYCGCCPEPPYQVDVVYEAGIPSGTIYSPPFMAALVTYADIELNELIGYGNEGAGDIGIMEFKNQDYSEKRMALLRTAYGNSPRANHAHQLLTSLRKYRYVGLGQPVR